MQFNTVRVGIMDYYSLFIRGSTEGKEKKMSGEKLVELSRFN